MVPFPRSWARKHQILSTGSSAKGGFVGVFVSESSFYRLRGSPERVPKLSLIVFGELWGCLEFLKLVIPYVVVLSWL